MTEPTQTPRTEAALQKGAFIQGKPIDIRLCSGVAQDLYDESQSLERELAKANTRIEILSEGNTCDKCVNPLVCNDLGKCGQVQMLQRDLALSTQRIAELESQLRTQASELTEAVRLARKFDVETVHLQERVKQLEGALIRIRDLKTHVCGGAESIAEQALSPSPPAVDTASKCPECGTNHGCLCDDAPPVQTEEKPATVPLAVAEKLAEALRSHDKWRRKEENQGQSKEGYRESWLCKVSRDALTTFQASTKE